MINRFDQQNEAAARVILATPDRYRGALLDWARAFLARLAREREAAIGPLFERRAA